MAEETPSGAYRVLERRDATDEDGLALRRTANLWGAVEANRGTTPIRGWLDSPAVRQIVQKRITGSADLDWLDWVVQALCLRPGGRWLSLGCGGGAREVRAIRQGFARSVLALDISAASLEVARERALQEGAQAIEFRVADLNALDLPPKEFDLVLMEMSLHHVKALEATLDQVARSLRPDGYLVVNEFVGPSQFQFTDLQLEITRDLLGVLPASLRKDVNSGAVKEDYQRRPIEHWFDADPSEAIRSDEIVGELEKRFDVVLRRDYGGAVLHLALEFIAHNFDPADEKDMAILHVAGLLEERLTRQGILGNDFTVMALRSRPAGDHLIRPAGSRTAADPAALALERDRALRLWEQARADGLLREQRLAAALEDRASWRRRAEELDAFVAMVRASGGWRLLQALRALVGRRW